MLHLRRRALITLFGGAVLSPLAARGQSRSHVPRVGYLFSFTQPQGRHLWEACQQGLRELGYLEGQNIHLEPRWAEGQHDRLPRLAAELVRLQQVARQRPQQAQYRSLLLRSANPSEPALSPAWHALAAT
jgi:putative ABC transport system substrate-binding protein